MVYLQEGGMYEYINRKEREDTESEILGGQEMKASLQSVMLLIGIILVLAVACGTAEAPDPTAAPAADPTAVTATRDTSQPTPASQEVAPPAQVEVNPGTLTIMVGEMDNERFDVAFTGGSTGSSYG